MNVITLFTLDELEILEVLAHAGGYRYYGTEQWKTFQALRSKLYELLSRARNDALKEGGAHDAA